MGRRFVRVNALPPGWALKSVRAGGMDVTDAGIEILENLEGVEIVVTASPTSSRASSRMLPARWCRMRP
jgi:hypothetical protein